MVMIIIIMALIIMIIIIIMIIMTFIITIITKLATLHASSPLLSASLGKVSRAAQATSVKSRSVQRRGGPQGAETAVSAALRSRKLVA